MKIFRRILILVILVNSFSVKAQDSTAYGEDPEEC